MIIFITAIISGFYAYNGGFEYVLGFALLMCLWGFFFTLPIGGADMPIIISVLNSLSGWCTVLVGFSRDNTLLIIVGTLVGASGTILSYIMTKAMNRNLLKVIFIPPENAAEDAEKSARAIHQGLHATPHSSWKMPPKSSSSPDTAWPRQELNTNWPIWQKY